MARIAPPRARSAFSSFPALAQPRIVSDLARQGGLVFGLGGRSLSPGSVPCGAHILSHFTIHHLLFEPFLFYNFSFVHVSS